MALNNMGLGFTITAKDTSQGVFKKAGQNVDELEGKAKKSSASMQEVGGEMEKIGKGLVAVGVAGLAGLGFAANEAGKFQKSIAEVSTLVDEATFPVAKMRELTLSLGQTYGGDINTQAKGLYQAISAGVTDATKATDLLTVANKLAVGGVTDVFTSVDVLTSVTAAYSASNLKAADAADILFTTVRLGKTTAAELGATLGKVAPAAASLGIGFDELSAALASVTVQGINTHEAVTGLKAALANIVKPTSDAEAEAARLGIKFTAAELRAKGFKGFLDAVTGSAKYNKDSIAKLFGSIEAFNTITALANNNSATFNENLKAMGGAAHATDAAFEKMSGTFDFQAGLLKTKLQVALVKIGDVILPLLARATAWLNKLVDAWNNLPDSVREAIVTFVAVASVVAIVVGGILLLVGGIMAAAASAEAIGIALGVTVGIFAYLAVAVGAAVIAFYAFKQAYEKNLGGFGTFVKETIGKVVLTFKALQQLFSSGGFSGEVMADLNKAGNGGIKDFAITVFLWFNRIKNFFGGMVDSFKGGIDKLGPVFKGLIDAFHGLADAFGFAKDAPDQAKGKWVAFGTAGANVGAMLAKAFGYVVIGVTYLVKAVTAVVEGFKAAAPYFDYVWNVLGEVWAAMKNVAAAFTSGNTALGSSADTWKQIGEVVGFVIKVVLVFISIWGSILARAYNVAAAYISGIVGFFSGLVTAVSGVFNILKGIFTGNWALMLYGAKQVLFGWIESIVSAVTMMVSGLAATFDALAKKVGKDLGLQKAVEGTKGKALEGLKGALGLDKPPPTVAPAGGAPAAAPLPGAPTGAPIAGGPISAAATLPVPTMPALGPMAATGFPPAGPAAAPPPPPIMLQSTTKLEVDGKVLAEIVKKYNTKDDGRSFGPTPTQQ